MTRLKEYLQGVSSGTYDIFHHALRACDPRNVERKLGVLSLPAGQPEYRHGHVPCSFDWTDIPDPPGNANASSRHGKEAKQNTATKRSQSSEPGVSRALPMVAIIQFGRAYNGVVLQQELYV